MARAALTMVCLLGSVAAAWAEPWPINQRSMQIPIKIEAARRAEIQELQLFYSADQGKTWSQGDSKTPDKDVFTFTAPADGHYWLSLLIVKRDGTREPPRPTSQPPSMEVIVDTTKPMVKSFTVDRQGEEIAAIWQIQESYPDWATLKVEYRTANEPPGIWTPVPIKGAASGKAHFRPILSGLVTVRMQVKDQAGNETTTQREVGVAAVSGSTGNVVAAPRIDVPPMEPPPLPSVNTTGGIPQVPPPVAAAATGQTNSASHSSTGGPHRDPSQAVAPPPRETGSPFEQGGSNVVPVTRRVPLGNALERGSPPPALSSADSGGRVVAATQQESQNPALPLPGNQGTRAAGSQPSGTILSNSLQVSLDYEVSKVGPSGVGSVELYLTRDNGASWQLYVNDPDLKPPMVVDLPSEGIYGMVLVVRSKAGLGRRPPQAGERPQMVLEVDTTAPEAQLYAPQPLRGQRDQLVISWEARDKNLTATPVTLEWCERAGGPWLPIGLDLPNTGKYTWKLPPNLPYSVFMRLVVKDAAGNQSVAETREPVLVDLSEPDGVILNIRAVGSGPR